MKINNSSDFGEKLRERRKKLGYTQRQLSEHTGLSISFLSDLERGKKTAELGKAIYVANILGLDIMMTDRG